MIESAFSQNVESVPVCNGRMTDNPESASGLLLCPMSDNSQPLWLDGTFLTNA
jgi:hypothetical protein